MTHTKLPHRRGLTLVEVLAVIAIIGLIAGLLLPAVQSARESARRASCANNFRQMGIATQNFENSQGGFPPSITGLGVTNNNGFPGGAGLPFFALILPYLDQDPASAAAGSRIDYSQGVQSGNGSTNVSTATRQNTTVLRNLSVSSFNCPTRGFRRTSSGATCDYGILMISDSDFYFDDHRMSIYSTGSGSANNQPESTLRRLTGLGRQVLNVASGPIVSGTITTHLQVVSDTTTWPGVTSYQWSPRSRVAHVLDGLSNTAILSEKHLAQNELGGTGCDFSADRCGCRGGKDPPPVPLIDSWGRNLATLRVNTRYGGLARGPMTCATAITIGSWHPGVCHFLLADGAVLAVAVDIDDTNLLRLADRRDGQILVLP